jgi:nucleoside-diphosphate-sugar epimerase
LCKKARYIFSKHKIEDLKTTLCDNKKLVKKLKIVKFIDPDEGIKRFVEWYKKNYK